MKDLIGGLIVVGLLTMAAFLAYIISHNDHVANLCRQYGSQQLSIECFRENRL